MPKFVNELLELIEGGDYQIVNNDAGKTKIIASKRTPEDSKLDSTKSLDELFNKIRACDSTRFPAFFLIEGEKVYIKLSRKISQKECDFDI